MNRINSDDTTHLKSDQRSRRILLRPPVSKTALSVLGMVLLVNDQASMGPSIIPVQAAEETILCSIDDDCKNLNEYYICKPIAQDQIAQREIPEGHPPKECVHKPLWPLTPKEWLGTFVFSLIMMLSNVAGIGGGGVAIPLAMYFFNLSTKPAIAISSFAIMISTLARFFYNFNERHPEKPQMCCIDYSITNVMMPLTMIGSLTGAFIYLLFPEMWILIILTMLLLVMSWESGKKYFDMVKKEKKQDEEKAQKAKDADKSTSSADNQQSPDKQLEMNELQKTSEKAKESAVSDETNKDQNEVNQPPSNTNNQVKTIQMSPQPMAVKNVSESAGVDNEHEGGMSSIKGESEIDVDKINVSVNSEVKKQNKKQDKVDLQTPQKNAESTVSDDNLDTDGLPKLPTGDEQKDLEIKKLRTMMKQEASHGQWKKQAINLVCLTCLIIQSLLRGGKGKVSIEKCSAGDWVFFAGFTIVMISVVYIAVKNTANEQALKIKHGNINLVPSDLVFEGKVLRNILALGFGGGWVAGALGLGGGVIFNPLLLAMGVPPKVSSATGMYIITFSKIATCLIYLLYGLLMMDYGLWIAFWSSIGAVIGLKGANWYMEKFGKQSIIVLCLTFIMIVSTIGVPFFGALDLKKKADNGEDIKAFGSIC